MTMDFASALRRALEKTCAADPASATAIIQDVLAGRAPAGGASGTGDGGRFAPQGLPTMPDLKSLNLPGLEGLPSMPDFKSLSLPGLGGGLGGGLGTRLPGAMPMPMTARAPEVPPGATYETRRHDGATGGREYRLYVPSPAAGEPAGLIVMLHGCTQNPDDFATGTRMNDVAEREGFLVAYPRQTAGDNPNTCWNWFRPGDQGRSGEPAILAGLAASLAVEFGLPAGQCFVAGLSAGGAMAAIALDAYPEVFAAAGVHSGLPVGSAHDVASAFQSMRAGGVDRGKSRRPLIVFHGDADATVVPLNGARMVPGDGVETRHSNNGRQWSRLVTSEGSELWRVEGAGHAWFGGDPAGSYADRLGPDASAEMAKFFKRIAGGDQ